MSPRGTIRPANEDDIRYGEAAEDARSDKRKKKDRSSDIDEIVDIVDEHGGAVVPFTGDERRHRSSDKEAQSFQRSIVAHQRDGELQDLTTSRRQTKDGTEVIIIPSRRERR